MQNSTQRGFRADPARYAEPARYSEPEPVFPLRRKLPSGRPAFAAAHDATSRSASRASDIWRSPHLPSASRDSAPGTGPSARPTPLPHTWPFSTDIEESGIYQIDDDLANEALVPRYSTRRQVAVRGVGMLAIGAVACACILIFSNPQAIREAVDWVTLGHADLVLPAAEGASSAAEGAGEKR